MSTTKIISEVKKYEKEITQNFQRKGDYDNVYVTVRDSNNKIIEEIFVGKFNIRHIDGCAKKNKETGKVISGLEKKYKLEECVVVWMKSYYDQWSEIHRACYVEIKDLPIYITEKTMRKYEFNRYILEKFYQKINNTTYKKL